MRDSGLGQHPRFVGLAYRSPRHGLDSSGCAAQEGPSWEHTPAIGLAADKRRAAAMPGLPIRKSRECPSRVRGGCGGTSAPGSLVSNDRTLPLLIGSSGECHFQTFRAPHLSNCRAIKHCQAHVQLFDHLVGPLRGPDRRIGAVLVDEELRRAPDVHAGGHAVGSMHSGV